MPAPSQGYIDQQRMIKACDLEVIAMGRGVKADDLKDESVREQLRLALAKRRGKRPAQVSVSIETWRVLWRLMHDREAGLPGDGR